MSDLLNRDECRALIDLARRTLEAHVRGDAPPAVGATGALALHRGAFVTIHRGGELRGCLGRIASASPLGREIAELASAVADSDPRFPPVAPGELPDLVVEISVLTPPRPLVSISDIEIGRHGLIVEQRTARGLLLPQVAVEHEWNVEQFLAHTCVKAGLPRDAWRTGARVLTFEAQVFAEDQSGGTTVI